LKRALNRPGKVLFHRGERGVTLVESLVAIAILGGAILTLVLTMSGGALAVQENDEQAVAQGLARTQLEYVKSCAYDAGASTYPAVSAPEGYAVTVNVAAVPGGDGDIQKITANVLRGGEVIMTVEDYKVDR
jgi:prepilin-type N-terminal cleavage/methylation domain-containing protein